MDKKNKWVVLSKKGKNFENLFISCLGSFITKPNLKQNDQAELSVSQWF